MARIRPACCATPPSLFSAFGHGIEGRPQSLSHQNRLRRKRPTNTMPTTIASSTGRGNSVSPFTVSTVLTPSVRQNSANAIQAAMMASASASLKRSVDDALPVLAKDQTFSTSGRPSSPEGKKMSTSASIENAATSLY